MTENIFDRFFILYCFFCSSTLVSATNQMYQCVAKLIRLCDDYLLIGDKALGHENVSEILQHVDDAIQVCLLMEISVLTVFALRIW